MSKIEVAELDYIEYNEAFNYAVNTYRMRSMAASKKKGGGNTDDAVFDQPDDFDHDPLYNPNFVSDVGKPR